MTRELADAVPLKRAATERALDWVESGMRDALGADTSRLLPFLQAQHASVLVEDPAPLWNLGAERYSKLAQKWKDIGLVDSKIAVDIDVEWKSVPDPGSCSSTDPVSPSPSHRSRSK